MRQSGALFTLAVLLQTLCPIFLLPASARSGEVAVEKKKAAPKKNPAAQIAAILAQPQLARADWGIAIAHPETGKTIYAPNANRLFLAAPHGQLLTTSALLQLLCP